MYFEILSCSVLDSDGELQNEFIIPMTIKTFFTRRNSNWLILRVWYNTEPAVMNDTETLIATNIWIRRKI